MTVTESYTPSVLVTKREAAETLQVSVRTIDRYIADGTLAAVRVSPRATRVVRKSLDELISAGDAA